MGRSSLTLFLLCVLTACSSLAPFRSSLDQGPRSYQDARLESGDDNYSDENEKLIQSKLQSRRYDPVQSDSNELNLIWPVENGIVSQRFKPTGKPHLGLDVAAPKNTPIYAAHSGFILYAGRDFTGYGKLIIIETMNSYWATFYSHCQSILVKEGQIVEQGQQIGTVGRTGRASGYHLHFELRKERAPVDPLSYLP